MITSEIKTEGIETVITIRCGVGYQIESTVNSFFVSVQGSWKNELVSSDDHPHKEKEIQRAEDLQKVLSITKPAPIIKYIGRHPLVTQEVKLPAVKIDIGNNNENELMETLRRSRAADVPKVVKKKRAPYGSLKKR